MRFLSSSLLLLSLFLTTGCEPLEKLAPPPELLSPNASSAQLQKWKRGRDLYITCSASCHTPQKIIDYSETEWGKIFVSMAKKAKLTEDEKSDLRAYLDLVLRNADRIRALETKSETK